MKEKDEKKFGSEKEMSLSLLPGLNEALYRILQRRKERKKRKRNCEKRRKKLGSNTQKILALQPQSKRWDGEEREERKERAKITKQIASK